MAHSEELANALGLHKGDVMRCFVDASVIGPITSVYLTGDNKPCLMIDTDQTASGYYVLRPFEVERYLPHGVTVTRELNEWIARDGEQELARGLQLGAVCYDAKREWERINER
jgi:hypothetical protein